MTTPKSLVFLLAVCLLMAAPVQAQVALLFDNGPIDNVNGFEMSFITQAEDFELAFPATATRIEIGMGETTCTFPANWDGVLRWWIYEDAGGIPGPLVSTGIVPDVSIFLEWDDCPTAAWYVLSFPLGQSVQLAQSVRYWLAIHMGGDWSVVRNIYWATTTAGLFSDPVYQLEGTGDWTANVGWHYSFMILAYGDDRGIFVDEFESGDESIWSGFV